MKILFYIFSLFCIIFFILWKKLKIKNTKSKNEPNLFFLSLVMKSGKNSDAPKIMFEIIAIVVLLKFSLSSSKNPVIFQSSKK